VAKVIEFYIPSNFLKKGRTDASGATRESDRVRVVEKEIGLSRKVSCVETAPYYSKKSSLVGKG
jgi:hypothetical protein